MVMTKDDYRKQAREKRDLLSVEELHKKSRDIFEKLSSLPEYKEAENILIYASMSSEVITDDIMEDALSKGKKLFCPKVTDRKKGRMEFARIYSSEDLKEGYFGIREPEINEDSDLYETDSAPALAIVPGVAFDKKKNRLGYSGGFYDRFFEKHPDIKKVALAFDCQVSEEELPNEAHDIRPDILVTEGYCY